MPTTAPPAITALPAAPDPNNRATFNALAYPWGASLSPFGAQLSALGANVKANADDAAVSSAAAAISSAAAASSALVAGAVAWVSGATYAVGDARYSPLNLQTYRRATAGTGTTDPSLDTVNWGYVSGVSSVNGRTGAVTGVQDTSAKDASGGYAGLTGFSHNLKNAANTFISLLSNTATAARNWVMPDKSGTVALTDDITGGALAGSFASVTATSGTLGYGAGAGGTVTQATSKGATVTLHKPTGRINVDSASLAAGAIATFQFNNSILTIETGLLLTINGVGNIASYQVWSGNGGAGFTYVAIQNISGIALAEVVPLYFQVIKGATS